MYARKTRDHHRQAEKDQAQQRKSQGVGERAEASLRKRERPSWGWIRRRRICYRPVNQGSGRLDFPSSNDQHVNTRETGVGFLGVHIAYYPNQEMRGNPSNPSPLDLADRRANTKLIRRFSLFDKDPSPIRESSSIITAKTAGVQLAPTSAAKILPPARSLLRDARAGDENRWPGGGERKRHVCPCGKWASASSPSGARVVCH
jgi:hypothetical protein